MEDGKMNRAEVIDELGAFIDFFRATTGSVPVCMTEAIRLLKEDEIKTVTPDKVFNV